MLEGSILQQLATAHLTGKRPLNFGVYYKNTLIALCHALEDCILASNSKPLVITAFQRGKWYLQEADRYHSLAQKSSQVLIMASPDTGFAEHPTSQLPNVALVSLEPTDPVAQEWHLIILSPTYTAMVLCQELSAADYGAGGKPTADLERKFYGFWTFEPVLVQEVVDIAIAHIGRYNPELKQTLTATVQALAAAAPTAPPDDLTAIVSRVVDYLHTSELDISNLNISTQHKALDSNLVSNELQAFLRLAELIDIVDTGNPMAASEVAALAEMMGQVLDLPAWQLKRLRLAGLLHRIAPMSVGAQYEEAPCCPLVPAAQVLRTMPRMRAIAQIINHNYEWWNGSGQPGGLAGEEIPLESRILGLVADFQSRVQQRRSHHSNNVETRHVASVNEHTTSLLMEALAECRKEQGDRWEPQLVDTLELLVIGMQQGLSLPVTLPKISAGMWLIDAQLDSEAKIDEENRVRSSSY
jgi:DICT domain-containing protein